MLLKSVHEAIERTGLRSVPLSAPNAEAIERGISSLIGVSDIALIGLPDRSLPPSATTSGNSRSPRVFPRSFGEPDYERAGGLMSYGDPLAKFIRRTAYYVDRIIRGANAGRIARAAADPVPLCLES